MQLPEKKYIASFDIDAQNTFTPVCPDELPVAEGDTIAPELNAQAQFASLRLASRDAHSRCALWISDAEHAPLTPISSYPDLDIRWPAHAIIGTKGFDFIDGLDEAALLEAEAAHELFREIGIGGAGLAALGGIEQGAGLVVAEIEDALHSDFVGREGAGLLRLALGGRSRRGGSGGLLLVVHVT